MNKFGHLQDMSPDKSGNRDMSPAFPGLPGDVSPTSTKSSNPGKAPAFPNLSESVSSSAFPGLDMGKINPEMLLKAMGTVREEMDGKVRDEGDFDSEDDGSISGDDEHSIKEEQSSDDEYDSKNEKDTTIGKDPKFGRNLESNSKVKTEIDANNSSTSVGQHYENYLKKMRERYANEMKQEEIKSEKKGSQCDINQETTFQVKIMGDENVSSPNTTTCNTNSPTEGKS